MKCGALSLALSLLRKSPLKHSYLSDMGQSWQTILNLNSCSVAKLSKHFFGNHASVGLH
jgi:hypothetical protein